MNYPTGNPENIVNFWRDAGPKKWFAKSDTFDADIKEPFASDVTLAREGQLDTWVDAPESCLALIILLDQFPRNLFRNTPEMFASDTKAVATARKAVTLEYDLKVAPEMRAFLYMPFMHSEIMSDQDESMRLFTKLDAPGNLKHAHDHADIIRRFGRFPHRNNILGRDTTAVEQAFLDEGGFSG